MNYGVAYMMQIIDGGTCTMGWGAVLLEVPWLPWQLLQLVLRCIDDFYGKL